MSKHYQSLVVLWLIILAIYATYMVDTYVFPKYKVQYVPLNVEQIKCEPI